MTTRKLTFEETSKLHRRCLAISNLYTELQSYESPEALEAALSDHGAVGTLFSRAEGVLEDLESEYAIIAFPPEVPKKIQKMFHAMNNLVHG